MSNTTIGALSVKVTADSSGLKRGIKEAQSSLSGARKSLNDNAKTFAKWGAAGTAAAVAIGAAIFKMQADSVRDLKNLAFAANETVASFQQGAFAAKQFGIENEKYGDILKDVNDRVGDFLTTGGGPMKDFFEQVAPKIGITADAFRGLSGQDALGLFVKSLQDANLSQEEMTFYMEAMASDSTRLIPLFQDNAKALGEMTKQAEALGIGLNAVEVEQLEQASKALDNVAGVMDSISKDIAAEFAPIVKVLADQFIGAAVAGEGFGNEIKLASDVAINAIGFIMDAVEGVKRTFQVLGRGVALVALGIQEAMLTASEFIVNRPVEAVNELIEAFNRVLSIVGTEIEPVAITSLGESIREELGLIRSAIDFGIGDVQDILNAPMPSEGLKYAVEEARTAAAEIARIKEDSKAGATKEEQDEEEGKAAQVSEESAAILEELQNRYATEKELLQQKLTDEQVALAENLLAKQITQEEFDLLAQEMNAEHQAALTDIEATEQALRRQQTHDTLNAVTTLMSLGGKKTEKAVRALSIASAIIKGHESAVAAFAAGMSTGGPFAPATAALYTAASIAQTGMMIAKLKSGSKSPSRPSGGITRASGGGGSNGNGQGGAGVNSRIDINLVGGGFFSAGQVRELIGQINEQVGDGVTLNTSGG